MKRFYDILGVLIKIMGGTLVAMFVGVLCVASVVSWSGSNREVASYECVLRRMDHHIADELTGAYHDTCMAAKGYRRTSVCSTSNLTADPGFCYASSWQFWER